MRSQRFLTTIRVFVAFVISLAFPLFAQVTSSQAKGNPNASASKWDVFVGYSILDPKGTFYPIQPDGTVLPVSFKLEKIGVVESAAYYFTRNVGIVVEGGEHDLFTNTGFLSTGSSNSGIFTLQGGLIYRWPGIHLTPFVHGLAGGADVDGPDHEPYTWGPIVEGGGGLDWYFGCHTVGIRLFEADYEFMHVNSGTSHGTLAADNFTWGDDENINALRLSAGIVFRGSSYYNPVAGCGPIPPPVMTCLATPDVVYPGDPVTITATPSGLNPKQTVTYEWTGAGATGNANIATVSTKSLPAGTYTVHATVTEGPKHPQSADCEASFKVKPWLPPTLTCSASPLSINPDETSTITLEGRSPQNLPLAYTCTSTAGMVTMNGNKGTFSPNGAPEGAVTINCQVADDKGLSANCKSTVTIVVPKPPTPLVQPLCSIVFSSDSKHPTRVNNEAKACLDQVALALQQHPDENLVVVGEAAGSEVSGPTVLGAQRAVNTKEYLTTEKGIDPSRITVVVGGGNNKEVEDYLVPTGATFSADVPNTTPVDENIVKPQQREPLPIHAHTAAKPAAAKSKPEDTSKKPGKTKQPDKSKKPEKTKQPEQKKSAPAPAVKPYPGP